MTIKNVLASVAVKDLETSVKWYERLFHRPADSRPMDEVAEWKFPAGGWLQVCAGPERAGGCSCTLIVSDIEEEGEKLKSLGVEGRRLDSDQGIKTIMIKDPDGNSIAFAQGPTPAT